MFKQLFAGALICLAALSAQAATVTNGSFESGITGWTVSGADYFDAANPGGPDGTQHFFGYDNNGFATLSQDLTTVAGMSYELSFYSKVYQIVPGNILRVDVGDFLGTITSTLDWSMTTLQFTALSNTTSLGFLFETDPGTGTWSLDGISVSKLSPVPVPATVWLFAAALIGFVGFSRRQKVS